MDIPTPIVDIYASRDLFRKLWPKYLEAGAVEAIAELEKGKTFEPATAEAIVACFEDVERGKASEKEVTKRIKMVTQETKQNILFETKDAKAGNSWFHRNYIKKK